MIELDIAVYSPQEKLILVVEVKASSGSSTEWATRMRRNLFSHFKIPPSPFFMIVTHKHIFLWVNNHKSLEIPPNFEADTNLILSPYFNFSNTKIEEASGYSLEIAVASWLNDIISSNEPILINGAKSPILYDSGLYQSIVDGKVVVGALA